jgi:HEXXH motif-containing protein
VSGRHQFSPGDLDALARGYGDEGAVRLLRAAALSKHLLLLKYAVGSWTGGTTERDAAVAILANAQERAPEQIAGLFADPAVGSWVVWTSRRLTGSVPSAAPLVADLGHLTALAAVASLRAGMAARLTGYVRSGAIAFPTLGSALLPLPDGAPAQVTVADGELRVEGGGATVLVPGGASSIAASWLGRRYLRAAAHGLEVCVALDDVDPYRGGHHVPPAARLAESQIQGWRDVFAEAWELLAGEAPVRARELVAGLRTLVLLAGRSRVRPAVRHCATASGRSG